MGFRTARRRLTLYSYIAILLLTAPTAYASCAVDSMQLRGDWGRASFTVELADTPETRARGLMFRESMARSAGMLFIYDRPQTVSFWMRNTPLPLDLLFYDQTGTLMRIHENAIPFDETPIPGGRGIQYVLEINAGLSAQFGFAPGDQAQHPAFDADAAVWPCSVD